MWSTGNDRDWTTDTSPFTHMSLLLALLLLPAAMSTYTPSYAICGTNSGDQIYCASDPFNPTWLHLPGGLKWITVKNDIAFGTNANNDIYVSDSIKPNIWRQINGKLKQISFDGRYICGTNSGDAI